MTNIINFPQKLKLKEDYTWNQLMFQAMKDGYTVFIDCVEWEENGLFNFVPMARIEKNGEHIACYFNDRDTGMFHYEFHLEDIVDSDLGVINKIVGDRYRENKIYKINEVFSSDN